MRKKKEENPIYINRELSWLKFNERVLEEAADPSVPLLERLKFVAIFMDNLDEFFMIRVGTIQDQLLIKGAPNENKTGMTAREQLSTIFKHTRSIVRRKDAVYLSIAKKLSRHGIRRLKVSELSDADEAFVHDYFKREIFPLLSPQIIDNRHPFPFLANKGIYVGLYFESHKDTVFGIIPAVGAFDRICTLPGPGIRFVLIEDIIYHYAATIFGSHNLLDRMIFRVTRSADMITETMPFDDDIDFRTTMKELLKKRVKLAPVRLEIRGELKKEFIRYLCKKLLLHQSNVFMSRSPLDLSYVYRFADRITEAQRKRLLFPPLSPQPAQAVLPNVPVMRQVLARDLLFSYPYESLRHFLQLLDEAADDPDVASIRITLYRVGKEAKLIRSLMRAAENGKEVLAVVELNARFDEEDNIEWATQLVGAGCRVVYGIEEYKVHSKVLLIMRKSDRSIQYITQIGTGNYNERTSRQYTDFSLLTSNPEIGLDAVSLFNDILVNNLEGKYRLLWVAPSNMQASIIARIDNEIAHARAGRQAGILVKMNSLTNKDVIDKLIEASQAGVRIRMIVRGICCLRPGVPGLTDNITVVSIVGRFLEHARVYCFGDGARREVYISSADWMTRNLERRIEVACPVLDGVLARRITDMLETQLRDNVKARVLQPNGSYARQHGGTADGEPAEALDSQMHFYFQAYAHAKDKGTSR